MQIIKEVPNATNYDLQKLIIEALPHAVEDTAQISEQFRRGSISETVETIKHYLRDCVEYFPDLEHEQTVQLPPRLIKSGKGDCKSFSVFAASILHNLGHKSGLRFAAYDGSATPSHVYTIVEDSGKIIPLDATIEHSEEPPTFKIDHWMKGRIIRGISASADKAINPQTQSLPDFDTSTPEGLAAYNLAQNGIGPETLIPTPRGVDVPFMQFVDEANTLFMVQFYPPTFPPSAIVELTGGLAESRPDGILKYPLYNETFESLTGVPFHDLVTVVQSSGLEIFFEDVGEFVEDVADVIVDAAQWVWEGLATLNPILVIARAAFLSLVRSNVDSLANRINTAKQTQSKWQGIKNTWENVGGSVSALEKAVNDGKTINGIGLLPLTVAVPLVDEAANVLGGNQTESKSSLLEKAAEILKAIFPFLEGIGDPQENAEFSEQVNNASQTPDGLVTGANVIDALDNSTGQGAGTNSGNQYENIEGENGGGEILFLLPLLFI